MTNEEYIKSLSTEDLAKKFIKFEHGMEYNTFYYYTTDNQIFDFKAFPENDKNWLKNMDKQFELAVKHQIEVLQADCMDKEKGMMVN